VTENHLHELDPDLRRLVETWRADEADAAQVDAALGRIAARRPARSPSAAWRLVPLGVAAAGLAAFLALAPAAAAEVSSVLRQPAVDEAYAARRAAWRTVLIWHISSLVAGYLLFFLGWAAVHLGLVGRLVGRPRAPGLAARVTPWLAGGGSTLWLAGVLLGCAWAGGVLGRTWAWHPKETCALVTLAIGLGWTVVAWRGRASGALGPAVAAVAAFWLMAFLWWLGSRTDIHVYGYPGPSPVDVVLVVGLAFDLLFVAAVWLVTRRHAPLG